MKLLTLFFVIFIMVSIGSGNCNGGDEISGKYRTIVFVQPSATDYPVNLHEKGGYVELNLKTNLSFEAKWYVPSLPEHHLEKNEMIYKGRYSVSNDTIKIFGTNTFWDNETFIFNDRKLELVKRLRRGPMDLVFEKIEE